MTSQFGNDPLSLQVGSGFSLVVPAAIHKPSFSSVEIVA